MGQPVPEKVVPDKITLNYLSIIYSSLTISLGQCSLYLNHCHSLLAMTTLTPFECIHLLTLCLSNRPSFHRNRSAKLRRTNSANADGKKRSNVSCCCWRQTSGHRYEFHFVRTSHSLFDQSRLYGTQRNRHFMQKYFHVFVGCWMKAYSSCHSHRHPWNMLVSHSATIMLLSPAPLLGCRNGTDLDLREPFHVYIHSTISDHLTISTSACFTDQIDVSSSRPPFRGPLPQTPNRCSFRFGVRRRLICFTIFRSRSSHSPLVVSPDKERGSKRHLEVSISLNLSILNRPWRRAVCVISELLHWSDRSNV